MMKLQAKALYKATLHKKFLMSLKVSDFIPSVTKRKGYKVNFEQM